MIFKKKVKYTLIRYIIFTKYTLFIKNQIKYIGQKLLLLRYRKIFKNGTMRQINVIFGITGNLSQFSISRNVT